MSSISYLLLDGSNDPVFDTEAALTDAAAVSQAILTRLRLFLGEWWENLLLGLPVFQSMLGQLASSSGIAAIQDAIQQNILGTPYVTSVTSVEVSFKSGALTFTATAQTAFGAVTVAASAPGYSANLGD